MECCAGGSAPPPGKAMGQVGVRCHHSSNAGSCTAGWVQGENPLTGVFAVSKQNAASQGFASLSVAL